DIAFQYGETTIYPLKDEIIGEGIVKRDPVREEQLLLLLRDSGFIEINQAMFLFQEEAIYQFLHDGLEALEQLATVLVSSQVKNMIIDPSHYTLNSMVDYQPSEGMLDITFDIEGITEEHVTNILQ